MVGIQYTTDINYSYKPVWEIFFGALARPIWGIIICWIIYACHYDVAGMENISLTNINSVVLNLEIHSTGWLSSFLSYKFFCPLSKLSYCIYCTHPVIPLIRVGLARSPVYFSDYAIVKTIIIVWISFYQFVYLYLLIFTYNFQFYNWISDYVITVVCAFFWSLTFEIPISVLEEMIFGK